ncbi:MAG: hypothetical protein NXI30_22425 [bacterium]|nr:hypothetical protein [bacterium]
MALRPLAFSVRLRDREKGRTLHVRNDPRSPKDYLLEDERGDGVKRVRRHGSAREAVRDAADTWRKRLN